MPIYADPPWGSVPNQVSGHPGDDPSVFMGKDLQAKLFTHDTTGQDEEVIGTAQFRNSQYGRWLASGDPHLEQAGTIAGSGDRIIRFPDGSFGRYGRAHDYHLQIGAGQHPGEASGSTFDRWVAQLTGGERFDYNGPTVFGNFLSEETAPGGFLSPANQSLATARGVRDIFNQGRQQKSQLASSLAATGLNERYARGAVNLLDQGTAERSNEYLTSASVESGQRRFEATLEFLNQAAAATKASQVEKANLKRAQEEARRRQSGQILGAVGGVIGGYFGGAGGAAAGYGIGSAVGSGIR